MNEGIVLARERRVVREEIFFFTRARQVQPWFSTVKECVKAKGRRKRATFVARKEGND
jgi:hypothetical protein